MIARDKVLHLIMGTGAAVVMAGAHSLPLGAAVAIASISLGVFYEAQQWYRKEGQVEVWDAVATSTPGVVAGIIIEVVKYF